MKKTLLLLGMTMAAVPQAKAESPLISDGKVSGYLRAYDFTRDYSGNALTDLHSFSLGGKLGVESGSIGGFSAAAGFYFAHDIGFNNYSQNNKYLNPLLMGTSHGLDVLGEAFLQYKNSWTQIRAGDQKIDNPWVNPSDGFMMPNLYQGITSEFYPAAGLKLSADRIWRFKNRTVSSFQASNLFELPYSNPRYNGSNNGTLDLGASYEKGPGRIQAWFYNFYDFAKMTYVEGGYRFPMGTVVSPFADFEYMKESNSGAQFLGSVDSRVYGARIGLNIPQGNVFFAYDKVPYNQSAGISNGNLLSPYTQIYNTDPLYTTVMNYGLVSARGAGHAAMLGTKLKLLDGRLDLFPTLSRYSTEPFVSNVNAFMFDIAYHMQGRFKGLILRNRLGIEHGLATWGNRYVDERVMLQYNF